MAAAIPALIAGAAEVAPMILSGITTAAAAKDLFNKYKPSGKSLNSIVSNFSRKSVGKFFKGLASPKGIGRLLTKIPQIAQDASSVISHLDNMGLSNDYTKQASSLINQTATTANSLNDMMTTTKQKVKAITAVRPEIEATIAALPVEEYSQLVPKKLKKKLKKKVIQEYATPALVEIVKKTKKNKILPTVNERSRTYR